MRHDRTSYSEAALLAHCEKAWTYRYLGERRAFEPSVAMQRGTFVHDVVATWWDDPTRGMASIVNKWGEEGQQLPDDGEWVALRYEERYDETRQAGDLRVIGNELKLVVRVPGTQVDLVLYIDQLVLDRAGQMWIVERKTMKDWRRLDSIDVDQQVSLYVWAFRQAGVPVVGAIYDAIRTYRWQPEKPTITALAAEVMAGTTSTKKEAMESARALQAAHPGVERPVEDSFRSLWLERTPDQLDEAVADLQAAIQRKALLAAGLRPMRNIGMRCSTCDYRTECWEGLAYGPVELLPDGPE